MTRRKSDSVSFIRCALSCLIAHLASGYSIDNSFIKSLNSRSGQHLGRRARSRVVHLIELTSSKKGPATDLNLKATDAKGAKPNIENAMDEDGFLSPIAPARRLKRPRVLDSTPDESSQAAKARAEAEAEAEAQAVVEIESSPAASSPRAKRPAKGPARPNIRGFIFDEARSARKKKGARPAVENETQSDDNDEEDEHGEGTGPGEDEADEESEDLDADLEGFVISDNCNDSQLFRSSAPESDSAGSGGSSSEADPYLASMLSQVPVVMGRRAPIQSKFTTKAGMYGKGRFHMKWDVKAENHLHLDDAESSEHQSSALQDHSGSDLASGDDNSGDGVSGVRPVAGPKGGASQEYDYGDFGDDLSGAWEDVEDFRPQEPTKKVGSESYPVLSRIIMPRGGDYNGAECSLQFDRILRLAATDFTDE